MAFEFRNQSWQLTEAGRSWPLNDLIREHNRPIYVYDLGEARSRAKAFLKSGARVHYAMKANSHPRLLKMFADEGLGVDVVSLGEMQKALRHGFLPEKIIFSGVGKGAEELTFAVKEGVSQINVESLEELRLLAEVAGVAGRKPAFALRVNVHIDAPTHKNIKTATEESKFGIDVRQLPEALDFIKNETRLDFSGLAVHVGSQIGELEIFRQVRRKMLELTELARGKGLKPRTLDLGGGLGLDYQKDGRDDLKVLPDYFSAVLEPKDQALTTILEPGRFLVARMGVLLLKVVHVKQGINRRFAILNGGMNALMRPALYEAYHRIEPLSQTENHPRDVYTVVGPICESTDVLAEQREMPALHAGDWVGIFEAGAYGAAMANTYNEMPKPEEWSVLDGRWEIL